MIASCACSGADTSGWSREGWWGLRPRDIELFPPTRACRLLANRASDDRLGGSPPPWNAATPARLLRSYAKRQLASSECQAPPKSYSQSTLSSSKLWGRVLLPGLRTTIRPASRLTHRSAHSTALAW